MAEPKHSCSSSMTQLNNCDSNENLTENDNDNVNLTDSTEVLCASNDNTNQNNNSNGNTQHNVLPDILNSHLPQLPPYSSVSATAAAAAAPPPPPTHPPVPPPPLLLSPSSCLRIQQRLPQPPARPPLPSRRNTNHHANQTNQITQISSSSRCSRIEMTNYLRPNCVINEPDESPTTKSCFACSNLLSIRWFILLVALIGLVCAVIGTILGALRTTGREHLTLALLMIGL